MSVRLRVKWPYATVLVMQSIFYVTCIIAVYFFLSMLPKLLAMNNITVYNLLVSLSVWLLIQSNPYPNWSSTIKIAKQMP